MPSIPAVFIRKSVNFFASPLLLRKTGAYLPISPGKICTAVQARLKKPCRTLLKCLSNIIYITKNQPRAVGLMVFQQCSIFPGRRQPSIFDDEKLNYCVRNVNRWILFSIATGNGITSSIDLELLNFTFFIISNWHMKVKKI